MNGLRRLLSALAGGVLTVTWLVPIVAATITMAGLLRSPVHGGDAWGTVVLGLQVAAVFWVGAGCLALPFSLARHVNPRSWSALTSRRIWMETKIAERERERPGQCTEVRTLLENTMLNEWPALRWATRGGFVEIWATMHRAEEALVETAPREELAHAVGRNRLRLEVAIGISMTPYLLLDSVAAWLAGADDHPHAIHSPADQRLSRLPPVTNLAEARLRTRHVSWAVNDHRERNWAGLVQLRNQTLSALIATEIVAYAVLVLATVGRPAPGVLVAASVYFLVAAVVGLLDHLNRLRRARIAVDDYGLHESRLKLVPMVSGLAGIGGVLVMALIGSAAIRPGGPAGDPGLPPLTDVFSLAVNPEGILFAALFGVAPGVLLARLHDLAKTYEQAILSTQETEAFRPGRG